MSIEHSIEMLPAVRPRLTFSSGITYRTYAVADQAYGSNVPCLLWWSLFAPAGANNDHLNWTRTLLPQAN